MKKHQQSEEPDFPFIADKNHIYNVLVDQGLSTVELGWKSMEFELHANLKSDGQDVDGVTEFHNEKIKLEMALSDKDARETILHEIMHCVAEKCSLHEDNYHNGMVTTTNEALVNSITREIVTLNFLNPRLLSVLLNY